ncbi:hypothetical protein CDCA_CDCA04G1368 [Cyanidium caldarium]|uniref:MRN complex-interacting protein N-terminal domain-containing protein n=1 Tax=Cyanidium caldarium TaxID=2771 RepID=A0AAV9ITD8_CYACA|nr:hypothetical protein CDCA_CDCA04G1368 [Cyanidium caldarium]
MPQTFIGVQCCTCAQFQVQQERRDGRFQCRCCAQLQSVQRVVARSGLARDVRQVVQRRNRQRGEQAASGAFQTPSCEDMLTPRRDSDHSNVEDTDLDDAIQLALNGSPAPVFMADAGDDEDERILRALAENPADTVLTAPSPSRVLVAGGGGSRRPVR